MTRRSKSANPKVPRSQPSAIKVLFSQATTKETLQPRPDLTSASPSDMAANNNDFRSLFIEMSTDLKSSIKEELSTFRSEISKGLADIRRDIADLGKRVDETESSVMDLSSRQLTTESRLDTLERQHCELQDHADDLENRLRRDNVRVRNVPEGCETSEGLECYLQALFAFVLGSDSSHEGIQIDRSHRVGRMGGGRGDAPRDILVKKEVGLSWAEGCLVYPVLDALSDGYNSPKW